MTEENKYDRHNKIAATLLAIILGGIGAHKFYLGSTGLGVGGLSHFLATPVDISLRR